MNEGNIELSVDEDSGGYYMSEFTCGSTYGYTIRCGNEFVSCDSVLIMEDDEESLMWSFAEWKEAALAGEEGYRYWTE